MAMKGVRSQPTTISHQPLNVKRYCNPYERKFIYVSVFLLLIISQICTLDALPIRRGHLRRSASRRTGITFPPCLEDNVGARAFRAETVFEGKARSRSSSRNGIYNVTFVVRRIIKGATKTLEGSQVRLEFNEKVQDYRVCPHDKSIFSVNITPQKNYIVFVDRVGPHIFKAHREPVKKTIRYLKEIEDALCAGCVRPPALMPLRNVTISAMERLRLTCRLKSGNPIPVLHWYKDDRRIKPEGGRRIHTKNRKRSILVIKHAKIEDAGVYKCRATSATGHYVTVASRVTVKTRTRDETSNTTWPFYSIPCETTSYCLNGGTCRYFDAIGEHACLCAEGFKGQRCESKDASNQSSTHRHKYSCPLVGPCSYYS